MRLTIFATLLILISCQGKEESSKIAQTDTFKTTVADTVIEEKLGSKDTLPPKAYANKRFKDVIVERIGKDSFLIRGRGQILKLVLIGYWRTDTMN